MLVSISVISTFFTMLYGLKYGKESSIKWVLSMALSLFQSIFILQPLKVLGLAIFFALILKRMDDEESEEVEKILLDQNCSWEQVKRGVYSGDKGQ
ncbi:polycystic kidney disease protein 1-like 2 [Polyodon spathula]|uniref:polycystic kidney disease protein 1-like 2 n=1 Tax=Polyodon spathula TaxID=7913 RepID=UPI001B7F4F63|nr:polycystic kidney disease protein 1-like 2 [Polyodon spathula]